MIYKVVVSDKARQGIERHNRAGNKRLVSKIDTFLEELALHPRSGTGQPERMRHVEGERWSRHIDHKHRLLYSIEDDKLIVIAISAYGHYGDK